MNIDFSYIKTFILATISFFVLSCGDKNSTNNTDAKIENQDPEQEYADDAQDDSMTDEQVVSIINTEDIPILLKVSSKHIDTDFDLQLGFQGKYKGDIYEIRPFGEYIDIISGKKETERWGYVDGWDCINSVPVLYCNIINNTDEDLNITSLDINVKESHIDRTPIINIIAECENRFSLTFINDSWIDWGNAIFEYSILKKGETFKGKYDHSIDIPYFEDMYIHNFFDDIVAKGLDMKSIEKYGGLDALYRAAESLDTYTDDFDYSKININDIKGFENVNYPFEFDPQNFGFPACSYVGKLTFKNGHTQNFKGKIILDSDGLGDWFPSTEKYELNLKPEGKDYILNYPYSTVIPKGGAEKIEVIVDVDKSSNHLFEIVANNTNDLSIKSTNIKLFFLKPRHGSLSVGSEY